MQSLTFGLTGREFQDSFNTEKYIALAYQQPRGVALQKLVVANWAEWCSLVAKAPWRTYWKKSRYYRQQCVDTNGTLLPEIRCGNIPLAVYSTAVWGFGVEGWLRIPVRRTRTPLYEILKLQGVQNTKSINSRNHMWDDKLYRGCGVLLPAELGELDRWLESLWQQVISSK